MRDTMKHQQTMSMNGEFLSHLSSELLAASKGGDSKLRLASRLSAAVDKYYEQPDSRLTRPGDISKSDKLTDADQIERLITPDDIERLSILLPWSASSLYNDASILGQSYNSKKRSKVAAIPDSLLKRLHELIDLKGKTCIESGCFEGIHSIGMAQLGAKVYGFDARIENVIKALVRSWVYGQTNNTSFDVINLESSSVYHFYEKVLQQKSIDLYHCRGVLYHLKNPVEYLCDIAKLNPRYIYFHTQVASTGQASESINTPCGVMKVFIYREKGRIAPFAGVEDSAKWLTADDLKKLVASLGYKSILIENLKEERNGLRLEILVEKNSH